MQKSYLNFDLRPILIRLGLVTVTTLSGCGMPESYIKDKFDQQQQQTQQAVKAHFLALQDKVTQHQATPDDVLMLAHATQDQRISQYVGIDSTLPAREQRYRQYLSQAVAMGNLSAKQEALQLELLERLPVMSEKELPTLKNLNPTALDTVLQKYQALSVTDTPTFCGLFPLSGNVGAFEHSFAPVTNTFSTDDILQLRNHPDLTPSNQQNLQAMLTRYQQLCTRH